MGDKEDNQSNFVLSIRTSALNKKQKEFVKKKLSKSSKSDFLEKSIKTYWKVWQVTQVIDIDSESEVFNLLDALINDEGEFLYTNIFSEQLQEEIANELKRRDVAISEYTREALKSYIRTGERKKEINNIFQKTVSEMKKEVKKEVRNELQQFKEQVEISTSSIQAKSDSKKEEDINSSNLNEELSKEQKEEKEKIKEAIPNSLGNF